MKFDVVVANPPFQDTTNKKKTQHKLWINFTRLTFSNWLKVGGHLLQVSPSSFLSPSSKVLNIFRDKKLHNLSLDTKSYFDGVGSTFADYIIENRPSEGEATQIRLSDSTLCETVIDADTFYLPNDFCDLSLSIHGKVMFSPKEKLNVKYDYVTCHNVQIHRNDIISKTETSDHIYPIYHTNNQVWYSRVRQDWANSKKVMWSRSGYTKPFYDGGVYGGTDMIYYITVNNESEGKNLEHNIKSKLLTYILKTAKWSGFGNEKVFCGLPLLSVDGRMDDQQIYAQFGLTQEEINYVEENC